MIAVADGTWDCHAHVIGDLARYPLAPGRSYDPPRASVEAYLAMLDRRGIARGVLVQPSVYGFDNACMLDALDDAADRLLGVAVPSPDSTPRDLESLHRRGVRGVRCNLLNPDGLDPETVLAWQPQLRELGWHVALHVAIGRIADLRAYLARFEIPVVVDHMGRPEPGRVEVPRLVDCVRDGACWVKLSAPYRLSAGSAPWGDVTPLVRSLLDANPMRCVWGSDWPHTDTATTVGEDELFRARDEWLADAGTRAAVLERAPGALLSRSGTPSRAS